MLKEHTTILQVYIKTGDQGFPMATLSMTPGYLHKERKGEGKYIPSCSISRLLIAIDTRQFEITAAALNIHIFFTSITHKFVENECSCGQNLKYKSNLIYLEFIFMLNKNYQCNVNFFTT